MSQLLLANDVIVDYRPGAGSRVAPHFYTTDEELHRFMSELDEIRKSSATVTGAAAY
jgi:kynureninase